MSGPPAAGSVAFGSKDWFRRAGAVSSTLGTGRFLDALVDLFGCLVSHESRWIIRFSDTAPPEVMHASGAPKAVVDRYKAACMELNPFAAHWRRSREPGVCTLSQFPDVVGSVDVAASRTALRQISNVSDQLTLLLATIGQSSIGLVLDRCSGNFDAHEVALARKAFPLLNGLQRAHIGRIFDRMRFSGATAEIERLGVRPALVQDRHGAKIFTTRTWQTAVTENARILTAVQKLDGEHPVIVGDFVVSVERFDKYFPLAPGGRMLSLTPRGHGEGAGGPDDKKEQLLEKLTARERDVFNLIMSGASTSSISQTLSLTKGTVKNYKLRIYKKSGTGSERSLIQTYAERTPEAAQ